MADFDAGVSEEKRQFPVEKWIEVGKEISKKGYQILLTGTKGEQQLSSAIAEGVGEKAYSISGLLNLEEFIAIIKQAPLVLSVNTGTVHIAAAVGTPIVVLYAATNPQHTPWKVPSKVINFDVLETMRSKNEVIQFLYKGVYKENITMPTTAQILNACVQLFKAEEEDELPTSTLVPVTD